MHFNVANVVDLSGAEYLECWHGVHNYWQRQRSQRLARTIEIGMGPQSLMDRHGPLEAYVGGDLLVFKFVDARIVQE